LRTVVRHPSILARLLGPRFGGVPWLIIRFLPGRELL